MTKLSDIFYVGGANAIAQPVLGPEVPFSVTPSQLDWTGEQITYNRSGKFMFINGHIEVSGLTGSSGSAIEFFLPAGLNVETTHNTLTNTSYTAGKFGGGSWSDAFVFNAIAPAFNNGQSDRFVLQRNVSATGTTFLRGNDLAIGDRLNFNLKIPIAEWSDTELVSTETNAELAARLLPTVMDDVTATRLGCKVYSHGTNYNGGNAPTITYGSGGGGIDTVRQSQFIPYQVQDGSWRLKYSFVLYPTSAVRTSFAVEVAGVDVDGAGERLAGFHAPESHQVTFMYVTTGNNRFNVAHVSGTTDNTNGYMYSGDIPLTSKPNWAY